MDHLILHEDPISGNCYKIRLTASLLSLPIERRLYSVLRGDTQKSEFLDNVSSFGQVPVLQIGTSTFLQESNAASFYLADSTSSSLIPIDTFKRAEMLRWMFFEQNHHEVNIATLRFWLKFIKLENLEEWEKIPDKEQEVGWEQILDRMERHLHNSISGWFVGDQITLADICLYAYTHVAHDAGFDLAKRPAIQKWFKQVEDQPGYVKM